MAWYEMSYFTKTIHYHKVESNPLLGFG